MASSDPKNYPTSIGELPDWQTRAKTSSEEARRRFVQFVILTSVSSSASLATQISFKGGNALRFVHDNQRSTLDLDFSAEIEFPDSGDQIKFWLDDAFKRADRRYLAKVRCQSIHRKPPNPARTLPTYNIRVCYQFPGDRFYPDLDERLAAKKSFSNVVDVEISLNDVPCETNEKLLTPDAKPIRVCTLEDIIAEKLRALLQQIPRNRSRPQDVFDIASMVRKHSETLNLAKISSFLIRKSGARNIKATKNAFDEVVKSKAQAPYETEIRHFTSEFIPFDEAWEDVTQLVAKLDIPDR